MLRARCFASLSMTSIGDARLFPAAFEATDGCETEVYRDKQKYDYGIMTIVRNPYEENGRRFLQNSLPLRHG